MTATTARIDFARELGELLNVPLVACPPGGKEFIYPEGDRDSLSPDDNHNQLDRWRPGWAIMARTGGTVAPVDVDPRNGSNIAKTRQLLDGLNVRIFAEIATPSGGRHFYIAGHPELPSCSSLDGWPGIDILSHGKLVFLPGTQRPKYNGAGYEIIFDDLEALADGGDPDGAEAFANWVAERRGERERFETSSPWQGGEPDARQAQYLAKMLAGIHRDLSAMGKDSGRNTAVYNKALKCGNFIAGAGLNETTATDVLLDASRHNGLMQEDGQRSVLASIRSGIKNGKTRPRAVPDVDPPTNRSTPPATDEDEARQSSWWPIDLEPALTGQFQQVKATIGHRTDNQPLLYQGKEHSVFGEPEAGKGWLLQHIIVDELNRGGCVLYIDFEDDENTIIGRLHNNLGFPANIIRERFHYIRPENRVNPTEYQTILEHYRPTLVLLDGTTEGYGLHGWKIGENDDAPLWRLALIKPALRIGAATLSTDHVIKNKEGRNGYAIGGQHKKAGLTGVLFELVNIKPFGKGLVGHSKLIVHKDRNGDLRQHGTPDPNNPRASHFADLHLDATDPTVPLPLELKPPPQEGGPSDDAMAMAEAIIQCLNKHEGRYDSQKQLVGFLGANGVTVPHKGDELPSALQWLEDHGQLERAPYSSGKPRPGWLPGTNPGNPAT